MMDTKREIIDYINSNASNGVLLIIGKWGCGKSYLIKNLIKQYEENINANLKVSHFHAF